MLKMFKQAPNCSVTIKGEEGEEDKVVYCKYMGTVRELASHGSFITSFDVGLVYIIEDKKFSKVPLDAIQFGE